MDDLIRSMFEQIFGGGVFNDVSAVLKLNPSLGVWSHAWNAVDTIYSNVMVPIALGLMIIWFLVAFMEKSASEQVTFEQLFMLFAKLIAAKFLIDNGLQIFATLWGLGISLIDSVGDAFGSTSGGMNLDIEDLWIDFTGLDNWNAKIGIVKGIGILCQLLIPWLASLIMIVVVHFICYSRIIEMLLRMMAAPIALSDFMTEGLHGAGWRFLKNFLAICLQGMIMVAIAQIYPLVINTILNGSSGFWDTLLKYIAFSFAAIALMFKSLSISKELVGTS